MRLFGLSERISTVNFIIIESNYRKSTYEINFIENTRLQKILLM